MRADRPIPGNPWPHDMVLVVNDSDHRLLTLLFVRHAWELGTASIPALDPVPTTGTSRRPGSATLEQWQGRWWEAWETALAAAGNQPPPPGEDLGAHRERFREWSLRQPRSFTEVWGEEGVDRDAFRAWEESMRPDHHRPLEEQPERRALPALIGAWQRGLQVVVPLPFAEHWSVRGGAHHLVIAAMTREDTAAYSAALDRFA